ncbi:MAG: dihydroorotate dehydrogenase [Clostridia bacterium]|nr:dihydroorotate dehydrogenase [Clostridia bacterium]
MNSIDMSVDFLGRKLVNPIVAASGTFSFGMEHSEFMDIEQLGALTVKGITVDEKIGNPPPRITETPSGVLNSIGLQNPGIDYFIDNILPRLSQYSVPVIINISGESVQEYCQIVRKLENQPIFAIELNISCPNVDKGGIEFGTSSQSIYNLVKTVRKATDIPLIVKLSPNVTDICEMAISCEQAGADAICLINTLKGMAIDAKTRRPILGNIVGGLSGPAIKPVALRMVWEVSRRVEIPLIGMGGVMDGQDAAEFMIAGATAVGVGTANLVHPYACENISLQLKDFCRENNISCVSSLIGTLKY